MISALIFSIKNVENKKQFVSSYNSLNIDSVWKNINLDAMSGKEGRIYDLLRCGERFEIFELERYDQIMYDRDYSIKEREDHWIKLIKSDIHGYNAINEYSKHNKWYNFTKGFTNIRFGNVGNAAIS